MGWYGFCGGEVGEDMGIFCDGVGFIKNDEAGESVATSAVEDYVVIFVV